MATGALRIIVESEACVVVEENRMLGERAEDRVRVSAGRPVKALINTDLISDFVRADSAQA